VLSSFFTSVAEITILFLGFSPRVTFFAAIMNGYYWR
jgi:hypothetical protein